MKISVVVLAFNEEKFIGRTLISLNNQSEKPDEIIVVDNNSSDNTAGIAIKLGARVVKEEKQGITFARNRGFNEANYEIIARTDSDTIVEKDWIKKLKADFEKSDDIVAVSGPGYYYDFPKILQFGFWPYRIYAFWIKLRSKSNSVYGANMAIKKSAWEKIKNELCAEDKQIHEDVDLGIHVSKIGKVKLDYDLEVESSARRLTKNFFSYFIEYPIKLENTFKLHGL